MAVNLSIFNSKNILTLTRKILLFFLIMLVLDQSLGRVISYYYHRTFYGDSWAKENWLLSKKYDLIVLGSSRAFRHYVPAILTRQTGLSVFNAGANGQYLLYAYALFHLVLEKYTPRVIVLDILPSFIVKQENSRSEYERLSSLAPHCHNPEVKFLLSRENRLEPVKQLSMLYRFNSRILNILDNYRNTPGDFDNGYIPVGTPPFREVNRFIIDTMKPELIEIDTFKVNILKKLVQDARSHNIEVIASFSPGLEPISPQCKMMLKKYQDIFDAQGIPFIVMLQEQYPEFKDKNKFMDYIHMNEEGASYFTGIFASEVQKILHQKDIGHR